MEVWKVLGYRKVDFKDGNNRDVKGLKLYLYRDPENSNIFGHECASFFVSDEKIKFLPEIDQEVGISFNRFGKISSVIPYED